MLDRIKYEEDIRKVRRDQLDQVADYLEGYLKYTDTVREMPLSASDDAGYRAIEAVSIPRQGRDPKEVADELIENVFAKSVRLQHPRFFSFVTGGVSPYSLAGSILSDIYNINAGSYQLAPAASLIEEKLIAWMGSLAGFDENCGGLFTSGGSLSNLTAMIAARDHQLTEEERAIGCAYISDQAHSSIKKGMRLMGLRKDQIRILPTDDAFRIRTDLLEDAIRQDLADGKKPFLLVGTIGTTNTGSIDPLETLADIRDRYHLWLHVDGAYGGSILFSEIYSHLAKGVDRVDSLSWDTHKWALQVYSCSCVIARDKKTLISAFAEHPEYLADILDADHVDGWDLGIEMSRPARAIKLWYTVQAMGTDLLSDVIDYSFYNARIAEKMIAAMPGWEQTSPTMCGTLTFRYVPEDVDPSLYDELNAEISKELIDRQYAYVVTTTIKGKKVLRLNIINGNTTDEDVRFTVTKIGEIAERLRASYAARSKE